MMLNYDTLNEELNFMREKSQMADHIVNDHFMAPSEHVTTKVRSYSSSRLPREIDTFPYNTPRQSSSRLPKDTQDPPNGSYWNEKSCASSHLKMIMMNEKGVIVTETGGEENNWLRDLTIPVLKTPEEVRKEKLDQRLQSFVDNSTCHGFKHCFDMRNKLRRIIWIVIVLVSMSILAQKLYESAVLYLKRPYTTRITVTQEDTIEFPAISLCNRNDFRQSVIFNTTLDHAMKNFKKNSSYNIYEAVTGDEYSKTTKASNHRLEDMLTRCTFGDVHCSHKNFTSFYDLNANICFTINSATNKNSWIVQGQGSKNKLSLTINTEHYDYYDSSSTGIAMTIHDRRETPIRTAGIMLSVGFQTQVHMRKKTIINLPAPYETNCGEKPLKYFPIYSYDMCWLERLTDHVLKYCNCKDGFMPGPARVCSLQELNSCLWGRWEEFNKIPKKSINCSLDCEKNEFTTRLSSTLYPSNKIAVEMANQLNLTGSDQEKRQFIRDNYLRVEIYFDKLTLTKMEQTPSYDLMVLLGDIGGQFGLFLGSSILTYIEFFDLIFMLVYTKYFEMLKPQTKV